MIPSSVSSLSYHKKMLKDIGKSQSELIDVQRQISSGNKSDNFAGYSGQIKELTSLKAKISHTERYIEDNNVIENRINSTATSIGSIIGAMDELQDLMVLRRKGAVGETLGFKQQAESLLKTITYELNSNVGGRYLFAGAKTDTPPISDDPLATFDVNEPENAGYYQGDEIDISASIDDNMEMEYNVRADNEAFQKMFKAVAVSLEADQTSNDEMLGEALELINDSMDGLIKMKSSVEINLVTIREVNSQHEQRAIYWQQYADNIEKADILEAATKSKMFETVLQATFQTFSRISNLTLNNYLK